jgi:hypothetical protein
VSAAAKVIVPVTERLERLEVAVGQNALSIDALSDTHDEVILQVPTMSPPHAEAPTHAPPPLLPPHPDAIEARATTHDAVTRRLMPERMWQIAHQHNF